MQGRRALPDELAGLGGVNRVSGFLVEPDGEILVWNSGILLDERSFCQPGL